MANEMFDATKLSEEQLEECLHEMRRRGSAVTIYDPGEIMTMTDGWEEQPTLQQVEKWFDRDHLEELMSDAVREEVICFIDDLGEGDDADTPLPNHSS